MGTIPPLDNDLCAQLAESSADASLSFRKPPVRHEEGTVLEVDLTGVHPPLRGRARFRIERFMGGGFAGQVYRCRCEEAVTERHAPWPELEAGLRVAVKINVPPSSFARRFRNFIYGLAFQGPFSAQVNADACRAGLIWQELIRRAGREVFGRDDAAKKVYASFFDVRLGAWGEISEWVEGRTWRLEADPDPHARRDWRQIDPAATASSEYVTKRQFMHRLVGMLHAMGAPELARQYEWSTMKSQPNVLKRTDDGHDGLCAIDFRAGLALLPFLPMSPGDFKLIIQGLLRRRTLVQFDRCDMDRLEAYMAARPQWFSDLRPALDALRQHDRAYRRSLPDVTRQGLRLLADAGLRRDVRRGLVQGYRVHNLADAVFAGKLEKSGFLFTLYYLAGALPILGRLMRRLTGCRDFRRHCKRLFGEHGYAGRALRARAARGLLEWYRSGRVGPRQARFLLRHPVFFLLAEYTVGLLPFPLWHRLLSDPFYLFARIRDCFVFLYRFAVQAAFREAWFLDMVDSGLRDGMLSEAEHNTIAASVRDPFIIKYLKCLGAHFAMLPVTQVISLAVAATAAAWMLARGATTAQAAVVFTAVLAFFQVFPVSPGSIGRGLFVVYLMIRERELRRYRIAVMLSFVKYLGYLAFPLQMTATYPELARFLAARWATGAVRAIPVFGERGALLEHWVFDLFFNWPLAFGHWARPRKKQLLSWWMVCGLLLGGALFGLTRWPLLSAKGINLLLAVFFLFVLPRMLHRRRAHTASQ